MVELRYLSPRDLDDHPHQWRVHPDHQRSALRGVLDEIGIAGALLAYESPTTGKLTSIDGHLRKSLGDTPWPVLILDVDDAEAALLLATHDPLAALAEASKEDLSRLLHEVQSGDSAVQQMLSQLAAQQGVIPRLPGAQTGGNDPNAEWQGMPAFHQENQLAWKQLIVNFETCADLEAFAALIEQKLTEQTRSIWYPYKAPENLQQYRYVDDES